MDAQALLDHLDSGVAALAPDWTITHWNAAAARLTGLGPAQVVGKDIWIVFPGAKGTAAEDVLHAVRRDGHPRSYLAPGRSTRFEGLVFEIRVTRGPAPGDHLVLAFSEGKSGIDPESRAAQILKAFEGERRAYRELFTNLPSPALLLTEDGRILEANRKAVELLRAPEPAILVGRAIADWLSVEQQEAFAAALAAAVETPQRLRLLLAAGDPLAELDVVIAHVDPGRVGGNLLCLALDVSREVLLQNKLLRSDRLAQLGALVSGVAHELNNPLAAIAAFAELLAVDAVSPDQRESAQIINTEALRAGRVVQTLLDFARQRPRTLQAVDPKDVMERVLALQRSALKKARIQTALLIPDDIPAVIGDPQELQQVFLNAVANAREAIEGMERRGGRILIGAQRTDGHVSIFVEDDGPGLSPEVLDRVFEPFYTTKGESGTGLGLAISLGLVKAMNGRLWLENNEAGGARLTIELPCDLQAATPTLPAGFQPADRPFSVLVVEDEASVRRGIALMAERLGHHVTSVAGFKDALGRLHDATEPFDVVVVDVHLDESHTGFDLFDALRLEGAGREQRVVFTTGDSVSARTRDQLQVSARPVLKKPFNLGELREMLDRVGAAGERG